MVAKGGLQVDESIVKLVNEEIAPGTGVDPDHFWEGFSQLVHETAPRLARRHTVRLSSLSLCLGESCAHF